MVKRLSQKAKQFWLNISPKRFKPPFIISIFIFLIVFSVYLFTLAPTIFIEDSAEYITAIAVLGIPHPTGYPLYVLLGKLFTLIIPFGTLAWKVNLMSAFFGALTCSLVYLICQRLVNPEPISLRSRWPGASSYFISIICALILGFSEVFWSQSVVAEVYALNAFFVALLILILIIWQEKKKTSYLYWFSFLYGLSLTNHEMMILLAPIFAAFIFLVDKKIFINWRLIIKMFLLFLLGFSVYLYLPLRARQYPLLNWGNPQTFHSLVNDLTRGYYNDLSFNFNLIIKSLYFFSFLIGIIKQFYFLFLFLAVIGLILLFRKNKQIAWLTLGIFLLNSLGIIFLRGFGYSFNGDYIYRVYYLPCYISLIIWFSFIIKYLYQNLKKFFRGKFYQIIIVFVSLIILIYPVSLLLRNSRYNNFSNFWLTYDYYKCILEGLEPNSVFLLHDEDSISNDTEIFSLLYLQMAEKNRPDVFIVDDANLFYKKINLKLDKEYLKFTNDKKREKLLVIMWNFSQKYHFPLYTNFPVNKEIGGLGLASKSNGAVFKVFPNLESAKSDVGRYNFCEPQKINDSQIQNGYGLSDVLATIFYRQSFFYFQENKKDLALKFLDEAINLDNETLSEQYKLLIKARADWQNKNNPN